MFPKREQGHCPGPWKLERNDPKISYGVLDPSAFRSDGSPTIAQRLTAGSGGKIFFRPADNTRVPGRGAMGGWDQVRARLTCSRIFGPRIS
jgi:hypothetical protein